MKHCRDWTSKGRLLVLPCSSPDWYFCFILLSACRPGFDKAITTYNHWLQKKQKHRRLIRILHLVSTFLLLHPFEGTSVTALASSWPFVRPPGSAAQTNLSHTTLPPFFSLLNCRSAAGLSPHFCSSNKVLIVSFRLKVLVPPQVQEGVDMTLDTH